MTEPVRPLPAQLVTPRRQALAALSRPELEAVYRALPGRVPSPHVTLTDAALVDVIVWTELQRVARELPA